MIISDRLRAIRESKNLSQGDIQERTGLLRCYISRAKNGRTIPSVATPKKIDRERVADLRRHLPQRATIQDYQFQEGPRDLNVGDAPLQNRPPQRTLHQTQSLSHHLSLHVREAADQGLSNVHYLLDGAIWKMSLRCKCF